MKCLLALLLTVLTLRAGIVPASRMMTWTPGTSVGVPGGIPTGRTQFTNLLTASGGQAAYHCAGDGVTDDSAAIQAALIAARGSNQYVYAPAARYLVSTRVLDQFASNYSLRGDGPGNTIFLYAGGLGTGGAFEFGTEQFPKPFDSPVGTVVSYPVSAGMTAGSTVLTISTTATVTAGNFVYLCMNTPTFMHTLNGSDSYNITFRMTFKVVSKTGTTVTITPALPIDLTSYSPRIIPWGTAGGGRVTSGVGMEDFTIEATNGRTIPFKLQQAYGCWIKNVEMTGTPSRQFFLFTTCASEVRGCYTHNTQGTGPNHEGIDFVNDGCWNLVEDNVCVNGGKPSIIFGDAQGSCVGNATAYNYVVNQELPGELFSVGIADSHGSGNCLNLYEGNVCPGFASDGYYGSSTWYTCLRNNFHNLSTDLSPMCMILNHYANYGNIVGCVLGDPAMTSAYNYTAVGGGPRTLIYRTGYPNIGNFSYGTASGYEASPIGPTTPPDYTASPPDLTHAQGRDLNVDNTIIRHLNYIYATGYNSVESEPNDNRGTGVDYTITTPPNSFLYGGTPAWWPGGLAWPPIGPDLSPRRGLIPSEVRYTGQPIGTPATGARSIRLGGRRISR